MTETEKIKTDDRAMKAVALLGERTRNSLDHIRNKFQEINERLEQVDGA
jgi:hypothetical protein